MAKQKPDNKALYPAENKAEAVEVNEVETVKIRMKPGRAADSVAGPGETAVVSRRMADYLIRIGYATKEE